MKAIPADLIQALGEQPTAADVFHQLPPSHQQEYIQWISESKKQETREQRIKKTIEMLLEKAEYQA
ncbi:MAG: YdeI/OmpD-associated family protein [Gammaproteobacteria bacterium]|nr:YdeI/OmpD-associated family protein [Gammaproteobacteria bacterium]MDH5729992.1 YdeI/OmpD-associated family protein [Gammaproteobacteria bacterium]